jgi:large subunit ribosomal protein L1
MEKNQIIQTLKLAREISPKRNFTQSFDIIINLKELNLKKPEENVDIFVVTPNPTGKTTKVCALVDKDLTDKAKVFDKVIVRQDFIKYVKAKDIKRLAEEFHYFIAQANIMADIAKTFGKVLGARGKMPNPKAGCVITPASDLSQLKEKLSKTIRVKTKNELIIKAQIGKESAQDDKIAENALAIYNNLTHSLPKEEVNIKDVRFKLSMGPSIKLGEKKEEVEARLKQREEAKKQKKEKAKQAQPKSEKKPKKKEAVEQPKETEEAKE